MRTECEHLGEWISSAFKSLKRLTLENVRGSDRLHLYNSSIQELVIASNKDDGLHHICINAQRLEAMSLSWFSPRDDLTLRIRAPNLKFLSMDGNIVDEVLNPREACTFFQQLPNLESVRLVSRLEYAKAIVYDTFCS